MSTGSRRRRGLLGALALLVGLLGAACGDTDGELGDTDAPAILVTTTVLGDVVSDLVGDAATVEVLMPLGSDPHDFEPSARQAARLREVEVVVANGLGLEAGLQRTLDAARADGVVVVEVGELIDPLPFGSEPHRHDADDHDADAGDAAGEDPHGHEGADPHFWHDPIRMAGAIPELVDALSDAVPALDRGGLGERADALIERLVEVDAEIEEILAVVPDERRHLLTNHDNLGYFAARYGFEVIGTVIPGGDTLASPSAAELAELVREIDAHRLPAIFVETISATSLAETLAAEVSEPVEVVSLYTDSLGEPGSGADTYTGMLQVNARLVAEALA